MSPEGRLVRRALVVTLVLGALLASVVAFESGTDVASGSDAPAATATGTPVWSARRIPNQVVEAAGALLLQRDLQASLASSGVPQSCVAVADSTGAIAAVRDDVPLIPASTEKLLTGAATIAALEPDTVLTTRVLASAPINNGTVDRLWLVGGGDPLLATPEYQAYLAGEPETKDDKTTSLGALADKIVAAGVRRVNSGIGGDDAFLDDVRFLPTWRATYRTEGQVGPIGALVVNDGFTRWTGTRIPAIDPAAHAVGELARLLRERGVAVNGTLNRQSAPTGATEVATITSPPISEVVGSMMRSSNNTAAEVLARLLGRNVSGSGTTQAGTAAVAKGLTTLGVPVEGLTLIDGSGLDRGNQITCRTLLGATALFDNPKTKGLQAGLAIAGQTGTLAERFVGTPLAGKLTAKTGSLQGVSGLVGAVNINRPVRFALLYNGTFTEVQGVTLREKLATLVATYPAVPGGEGVVPVPGPTPPAKPGG